MRNSSTATAPKPLLCDKAKVFGFGMWNHKLEGTLILNPEELVFDQASSDPLVIPTDSIQAVEAGYFRMGPLPGTPVLRILHRDNVIWAVSVEHPEVWETSIRALSPHAHPTRNIPRHSKSFQVIVGVILLVILVVSIAIPVVSFMNPKPFNTPMEEALD